MARLPAIGPAPLPQFRAIRNEQGSTAMHAASDSLNVLLDDGAGGSIRGTDFGQLAASLNRFVPGTDLTPLLSQLPGGDCPVPHWGYVIEGSVTVHYRDGLEETYEAGEVFHMPPHHDRVRTDSGVLMAEFSPATEARELFDHVAAVMEPTE